MLQEHLNILLVDDERSVREPLARYLSSKFGFRVDVAADGEEALAIATENNGQYDVALIDQLLMSEPDGIELMRQMKAQYPLIECIVFTGWGTEYRQSALREGAFSYLEKPFDNEVLVMLIRSAAQQVRLRAISRAILSKRNLPELFAQIVAAVQALTWADRVFIVLPRQATGTSHIYPQQLAEEAQRFESDELSQEIITGNKVISVADIGDQDRASPHLSELGIRSYVGAPIPNRQGVLYAYSRTPDHFDEWGHTTLIQTLASQAGLALDNARALQDLRTHADYMEALVQFGQNLARATRLEEQLDLVWGFLSRQLQVSTAYVGLCSPQQDIVSFPLFCENGSRRDVSDRAIGDDPNRWGFSGHVIRHGCELIWQDDASKRQLGISGIPIGDPCQSGFCVPLRTGEGIKGLISIQSSQPNAFSEVALDVVRTVSNQLSVAIDNIGLLAATQRAAAQLAGLDALVLDMNQELDSTTLLRKVIRQAVDLLGADGGGIYLLNAAGDSLILRVASGLPQELEGQAIAKDTGLSGLILQTGAAHKNNHYQEWPQQLDLLRDLHLHAVAGAPIRAGERTLGTLVVHKVTPGSFFEDSALHLLGQFANHVGASLQKSMLLERLRTIEKLAADITSSIELQIVLTRTCQAVVDLFGVDHSAVVLFDVNRSHGEVYSEFPAQVGTIGTRIPIRGIEIEEELAFKGRPAIIRNVHHDVPHLGAVADIFKQFRIESIALIPIIYEGRTLGSISLDAIGKQREFTPDEIDLCKILANHVAVAVENARLFEETHRGKTYFQSLFEANSAVISKQESDDALTAIVEALCQASGALWVAALILDVNGQPEIMAQDGAGRKLEKATLARQEGISYQVIQSGSPRFIPDTAAAANEINPKMLLDGIKAAACLPLRHDELRGVLWIHFDDVHPFSESEQQALQIYASQAAIAFEKTRLFKSIQRREHQLRQMRAAAEDLAAAAFQPQQALQQIVDSAHAVLQADVVVLWPYDLQDRFIPHELTFYGITDDELTRLRQAEPQPGQTVRTVLREGYIAVDDIARPEYAFIGQSTRTFLESIGVQSFQAIVLRVGEEKLGVLFVDYRQVRTFNEEDHEALQTLAGHAALSLKTARTLHQQEMIQRMTGVVAEAVVQENIGQTLQVVAGSVRRIINADAVTLYAYDETLKRFDAQGADGLDQHLPDPVTPAEKLRSDSVAFRIIGLNEPPFYRLAEKEADKDQLLAGRFVIVAQIQASIGLQLRAHGRRVGVMFVNFRSPHRFTSSEIATLQLFADQAAAAIQSAQLQRAAIRRAIVLSGLYETGTVITSSSTLKKDTLAHIAEQAVKLTDSNCSSHLAIKYGRRLQFEAASSEETLERLRRNIGIIDLETADRIGIVGRVARTGQGEIIPDTSKDPDYIDFLELPNHSEMAVPIKLEGQVIGVINIEHPDLDFFQPEDLQALENLATQAAAAIKNARLYEQARLLAAMSREVTKSLEVKDFLESLFKQLRQIFKDRDITIHPSLATYDHDSNALLTYHTSFYPAESRPDRIPIDSKGIMAWVGRHRWLYYSRDTSIDPEYHLLLADTRSEVAAPLFFGGELLGVLDLESPQVDAFTPDDLELFTILTHQIATTVHNVQQFEELKQTKGLVGARTAVAWMGMVSAQWGHGVRNDATTIHEILQLLRDDLGSQISTGIDQRLARLELLANRIKGTPVRAPLGVEEGLESVVIGRKVRERCEQLMKRESANAVRFEFVDAIKDDTMSVRADPTWLDRILDMLVDNAITAMVEMPSKRLTVTVERDQDKVRVIVQDNGSGISADVQARLFKEPIQKEKGSRGAGIGLLLAQTIAQTYGGDIYVDETGPQGTRMVVWFPKEK